MLKIKCQKILKIDENLKAYGRKKFRLQYTTIGLTYSRCPISKNEILTFLLEKLGIEEYYIVQEKT